MIAPLQDQRLSDRPRVRRAHQLALENEQSRLPRRIGQLIEAQPELAIATAAVFGVALGWLIKRKEW